MNSKQSEIINAGMQLMREGRPHRAYGYLTHPGNPLQFRRAASNCMEQVNAAARFQGGSNAPFVTERRIIRQLSNGRRLVVAGPVEGNRVKRRLHSLA